MVMIRVNVKAVRACTRKHVRPDFRIAKSTQDQQRLITQAQYTVPTFYDADFNRFSVSKMNEEAKRSMTEWQEKLDKVTKDSEERISELQQKLAKVRKKFS